MFVQLMELQVGQRVVMKNDVLVEVVENLGDGIWIKGRVLSAPLDPDSVGSEDLCYCEDILRIDEST